jgi:hypothetical protein
MIFRLHAMYQRSRNVLVFLVVIFLAVNITNVVLVGMIMKDISGGKIRCGWNTGPPGSLMNTRGIRSLRHVSVHR